MGPYPFFSSYGQKKLGLRCVGFRIWDVLIRIISLILVYSSYSDSLSYYYCHEGPHELPDLGSLHRHLPTSAFLFSG